MVCFRWLSHFKACKRFVTRYERLIDTFDLLQQESRDPEIAGIRSKATSQTLVYTILLLNDILKPVEELNLYLQPDMGYFTNLSDRVKGCTEAHNMLIRSYNEGTYQETEFRY